MGGAQGRPVQRDAEPQTRHAKPHPPLVQRPCGSAACLPPAAAATTTADDDAAPVGGTRPFVARRGAAAPGPRPSDGTADHPSIAATFPGANVTAACPFATARGGSLRPQAARAPQRPARAAPRTSRQRGGVCGGCHGGSSAAQPVKRREVETAADQEQQR